MLTALVVLCGMHRAEAHEIGTTRVVVRVDAARYEATISTDAAALADKIATLSGRTIASNASADQLRQLFATNEATLRERIHLAFDGAEAHPAIAIAVAPARDALSAPEATIRLTGTVPARATQLTWRYGWTFASYSITLRDAGGTGDPVWLEGDDTGGPYALHHAAPVPSRRDVTRRYLALGFTHILPLGFDHVLFVLGIYLLSRRTKDMLWQVSAFTLAHSITLGLSMFGVVSAPPRLVEPLIALSIAYVAIENMFVSELRPWRLGLVFGFGLLHGLGFAGALQELGLPHAELLTALVSFNVGVEAGQLTVLGTAFLLVGWYCTNQVWYRQRVVVPASLAIACTGLYWTVVRLAL